MPDRKPADSELSRVFRRDPDDIAQLKELAKTWIRQGAVGRAVSLYRKALEKAPQDTDLINGLGLCHLRTREFDAAVECFNRTLRTDPRNLEAYVHLGNIRFQQLDHAGAAACYRMALDPSRPHPEALYRLGRALRWLNRNAEAAASLAEADKRRPGHAATLYHLGQVRKAEGRLDAALACFRRVLALQPGDVYALSAEASVLARMATDREGGMPGDARRVALHMNRTFHYAIMRPIFDALRGRHHALLTGDAPELIDFDPDVVVVADAQARNLRPLVPRALFVFTHHGLISKNQNMSSATYCDIFCASGEAMREIAIKRSGFPPGKVWMTGYVQMDALFKPASAPLPIEISADRKTVLFGPAYNQYMSAAPMLGERLVELIRHRRDDLTIIIKPHPLTCERDHPWMVWWRKLADGDANVHLVESASADVMPYLKKTDLLITDACSLAFEFLPLNRPIILLTNPEREKDPRYDALGIEWQWRDMGEEVFEPESLPGAVDRALADPSRFAEQRAHYLRLLFGDLADGRSAERIVEHISALGQAAHTDPR